MYVTQPMDILLLVRIPLASALLFVYTLISWTNGWILTKHAQTHYWEGLKKWLDFGDLDLIFKVRPALWNFQILTQKSLSAPYFLNQMTVLVKLHYTITLGWFKDLIRFWWPWPNFHHTVKTVKMSLVCTLSPEPTSGFWPNLHRNTIGTWERND